MKINTKNKIYIISVALVFIILIFIVFLVLPIFNDIKKSSLTLLSVKQEIASLRSEAAGLKDFQKKYADYQPNLDKIDKLFIDAQSPVTFIQFLEKISSESSVTSQISMPPNGQTQSDGEQWPYIVFQMNSRGSLSNLLSFSKKLESSPYLVEIQEVSMRESFEAKKTSREFVANFTIKVFAK